MTRSKSLKSRLDKLDGGSLPADDMPIEYVAIEDRPEWPDEVGDFIWSRMGVFYRLPDESIEAFVSRVKAANWPPRSLEELTDEELEHSLDSIHDLIAKAYQKPAS